MTKKIRKLLKSVGYKLECIRMFEEDEEIDSYMCFGYCKKIGGDGTTFGFTAAESTLEWLIEILGAKEEFRVKDF